MKENDIEFTIEEGHKIADALRKCVNLEECKKLHDTISKYMQFVNEEFGVISEDSKEKGSELTTCLSVAYAWRDTTFDPKYIDNKDTKRLFEHFLEQFEDYLDSRRWAKGGSVTSGD